VTPAASTGADPAVTPPSNIDATRGSAPSTDAAVPPVAPTSSAGRGVLVVGSYPPVSTAGAAVTVEFVRRLWADGAHPVVASPRASAAPLTAPVAGLLAGRRLNHLREYSDALDVVLCAERDLPVPTGGFPRWLLPIVQLLTVDQVVRALAGFDHVTLVGCGDHGTPPALWARLVFAADTVVDRSETRGTPGVTTLGPSESTPGDLIRKAGRILAPRIFGRHAPAARNAVARGAHLARRARAGVAARGRAAA
jgi:hypothetical protein